MNWRVKSIDDFIAGAGKKGLNRSLGGLQLMLLGIGNVIGTGIFVLTAEAAQKAGPAMMVAFIVAGVVCAVTALCYTELAAMVPVAGSAYTYSYAVFGELAAWIVGWGLIAEYAISASAVAVGWSNYFVGIAHHSLGWEVGPALTKGPLQGGLVNLPAVAISLVVTALLYIGTKESAAANAALVGIKVAALVIFAALTLPVISAGNFEPFVPLGLAGISSAASSIFFAYVGFDAVSTAAEETRNPQRNIPIGLIGSLLVCTLLFLLVSIGAIGAVGAQPILDPATGRALPTGSLALAKACELHTNATALVCSDDALAHVLRQIGALRFGTVLGIAVFIALPSVILTSIYAQSRIFFGMSRDGLLPAMLSNVHPRFKTPHVVTVVTGLAIAAAAAVLPVGQLADIANAGTLIAFLVVSLGVLLLRRSQPGRNRPFRTPVLGLISPMAVVGCLYLLWTLEKSTQLTFLVWTLVGVVVYASYGFRHSKISGRTRGY
jgi:APA family basic amino acid/polyamine antiporter